MNYTFSEFCPISNLERLKCCKCFIFAAKNDIFKGMHFTLFSLFSKIMIIWKVGSQIGICVKLFLYNVLSFIHRLNKFWRFFHGNVCLLLGNYLLLCHLPQFVSGRLLIITFITTHWNVNFCVSSRVFHRIKNKKSKITICI